MCQFCFRQQKQLLHFCQCKAITFERLDLCQRRQLAACIIAVSYTHLDVYKRQVAVIAVLAEGEPATPDAAANREAAQDRGVHIQALDGLTLRDEVFIARADALVDAVYGTGFHGALRPAGQRAAAMLNSGRFVLALDVPSGVCADTGETAEGAVRAHVTVAFHAPKPCHRLAAEQCGTVVTADIGIGAALGEE